MLWFMTEYAAQEVSRLKLGIHIHCLLPTLNPNTDLGRAAIAAYAKRAGVSIEEFAKRREPHLTPAIMGDAIVELSCNPAKWDQLGLPDWRRGNEAVELIARKRTASVLVNSEALSHSSEWPKSFSMNPPDRHFVSSVFALLLCFHFAPGVA